jgi:hypothetical protein
MGTLPDLRLFAFMALERQCSRGEKIVAKKTPLNAGTLKRKNYFRDANLLISFLPYSSKS